MKNKFLPIAVLRFCRVNIENDRNMRRCMQSSIHRGGQLNPSMWRERNGNEPCAQNYDNFLIVDFEATCEKFTAIKPQEIIEFPCLKLNAETFVVESKFHHYVRPVHKPELTPFCVELTGILQEMLVGQPDFVKCMELFHEWMVDEGILYTNFAFVTCGDWDFRVMLPAQCALSGIPVPGYMREWINIKKTFGEVTGSYGHSLMKMVEMLNLSPVGRHHSGIDDCRNIANITRALANSHTLTINGELI